MPGVKSQMLVYRYGCALEIDCPTHGDGHRLTLEFANPCDGEPPRPGRLRYYYRTGESLEDLTLQRVGRDWDMVDIEGHWSGYIVDGDVIDALHLPH